MLSKPETRWGAFAIHLVISAVVFAVLAAIIVFAWYPGFLFKSDGGWQGIRLIAGIDLILGPLLTLIVYNRAKKSLPFDLTVIGLVQFSALFVGCVLVYQERPIAVIYANNTFHTMSANSYAFNAIEPDSIPLIAENPKPVWIYAQSNDSFPGETLAEEFKRLGPAHLRVNNYKALEERLSNLASKGSETLYDTDTLPQPGLNYHRLLGRYYEGYLGFDAEKGLVDAIITKPVNYDGIKAS